MLRTAGDVDNFHLPWDRIDIRIAAFAQFATQRLGSELRIHWNHMEPFALKQYRDLKAVPVWIVRASNYGDGGWPGENRTNFSIGRIGKVHFYAHLADSFARSGPQPPSASVLCAPRRLVCSLWAAAALR